MYSRRKLFQEVKEFLEEEFDICLLNASDERYKHFICDIVKDTGKEYKRLRISQERYLNCLTGWFVVGSVGWHENEEKNNSIIDGLDAF